MITLILSVVLWIIIALKLWYKQDLQLFLNDLRRTPCYRIGHTLRCRLALYETKICYLGERSLPFSVRACISISHGLRMLKSYLLQTWHGGC